MSPYPTTSHPEVQSRLMNQFFRTCRPAVQLSTAPIAAILHDLQLSHVSPTVPLVPSLDHSFSFLLVCYSVIPIPPSGLMIVLSLALIRGYLSFRFLSCCTFSRIDSLLQDGDSSRCSNAFVHLCLSAHDRLLPWARGEIWLELSLSRSPSICLSFPSKPERVHLSLFCSFPCGCRVFSFLSSLGRGFFIKDGMQIGASLRDFACILARFGQPVRGVKDRQTLTFSLFLSADCCVNLTQISTEVGSRDRSNLLSDPTAYCTCLVAGSCFQFFVHDLRASSQDYRLKGIWNSR